MYTKKLLLTICLLAIFAISANAQINQGFKFDLGFGYGFGGSSNGGDVTGRVGLGYYLEPRYGLNEQFTLGFRFGGDILGGGEFSDNIDDSSLDLAGVGSYLVTAEYHFSENTFRPFGGLGVGLYSSDAVTISNDEATASSSSTIGVMPRLGFNLGHFRTALNYNFPFDEGMPKYLMLTIGVEIGGGRN